MVIIYTAIIGNIDKLWSAWKGNSQARFIAFVDKRKVEVGHWNSARELKLRSAPALPTWEQVIVEPTYGNRRTARYLKTQPPLEADYWIWVDGSVRSRLTPEEMIKRWLPANRRLATFKHPDRKDVYEEGKACVRFKKDRAVVLHRQLDRYLKDGFPRGWGLAETKVVIRRNCPKVRKLNELWWAEISNNSVRDQVSLPYACWKLGMRWAVIPGRCDKSKHFIYIKHSKGRK